MKNSGSFHISAQNIDCGYTLEPPRWGGSNECPQSMFLGRNKKNNIIHSSRQDLTSREPRFHTFTMADRSQIESYLKNIALMPR